MSETTMPMCHDQLDLLFVSDHACWPLDQGFRLRGYHLVRALRREGVRAAIASMGPLPADAPADLVQATRPWPLADRHDLAALQHGWRGLGRSLRNRLASFEGVEAAQLAGVHALVDRHRPRAVIGLGLRSPYMLTALRHRPGVRRIWYAADELVRFHLSCLPRDPLPAWPRRVGQLLQHAMMERLFAANLDGVIAVSPADARWFQRIAGVRNAITLRNGVDFDYFRPARTAPRPRSLVFWGRLDFAPNIDAVNWFARHVWPRVCARWPDARWTILGKGAGLAVAHLRDLPGVHLIGAVADLRPHVAAASAAILPMRSGGGIKNKLLEAAAMVRPILASPRAVDGLDTAPHWHDGASPQPRHANAGLPWLVCPNVNAWAENIDRLWTEPGLAADLAGRALAWVHERHDWQGVAQKLMNWLDIAPEDALAAGVDEMHSRVLSPLRKVA